MIKAQDLVVVDSTTAPAEGLKQLVGDCLTYIGGSLVSQLDWAARNAAQSGECVVKARIVPPASSKLGVGEILAAGGKPHLDAGLKAFVRQQLEQAGYSITHLHAIRTGAPGVDVTFES